MHGYGPPPGPYGAAQGYGAPSQPQQPYGAPPRPVGPAPAPKQSGLGLILAICLIGLLVVGGGITAIAAYFLLSKPGPHLAKYLPKDTSLYVEIPSIKRSAISAAGIKPIDSARANEQQMMDDTIHALSTSFSVSNDDAKKIVTGLDALAFAARDTNDHGKAAVIFEFGSTSAAEKLITSTRFTNDGPFGNGGTRYKLERNKAPATKRTFLEQFFDEMDASGGTSERLVWFPKNKILVFGDEDMVSDIGRVGSGSTPSLEKNEVYTKAKKTFESGTDVTFFFDTHDLEDTKSSATRKMIDAYLDNRDPVTAAIKIVKPGVMMDVHATLTGSALPPDDLIPQNPQLSYPRRLPADTVAYMAVSTHTKMNGTGIRTLVIKHVSDTDPTAAKELKDGLDEMERWLGFKIDDLIDAIGDEMAFGLLVDPAFKLDPSNGAADELNNIGAVYAIAVKDDAKAKAITAKIRAKLAGPDFKGAINVTTFPDGFKVEAAKSTPAFPIPALTVKDDGKQVIMVVGSTALTNRAFDALQKGTATLKNDKAHEAAISLMPKDTNMITWVDTGRITSIMLDGRSRVSRKAAAAVDLPLDSIRLTGDDRVTSMFAVNINVKKGEWKIDLLSLNLPALGMFSVAKDLDMTGLSPEGTFL